MKNVFTKEAKIGLVSIVSLALLYLGINYLKGINLFKPTNHYVVACTNVKGVTVSSPVFVEGFKVGLVREIVYDYDAVDKISIDISLEDHMKINKGSYITIVNSFLGRGADGVGYDAIRAGKDSPAGGTALAEDRFDSGRFANAGKSSGIGPVFE